MIALIYDLFIIKEIQSELISTKNAKQLSTIKIRFRLAFLNKKCIFAPLINRGRVPQNLIIRLCQ